MLIFYIEINMRAFQRLVIKCLNILLVVHSLFINDQIYRGYKLSKREYDLITNITCKNDVYQSIH